MESNELKKCPFCAELIKVEALKCRYCGSELVPRPEAAGAAWTPPAQQGLWRRVNEGKKIAGVCTGLARQFDSPVLILPLRVFFVASTLFYFFGPILYVILWILMPAPVDNLEQRVATPEAPYGGGGGAPYAPPGGPAQAYQPPQGFSSAAPRVANYPGQGWRQEQAARPPLAQAPGAPEQAPVKEEQPAAVEPRPEEGTVDLGREPQDREQS